MAVTDGPINAFTTLMNSAPVSFISSPRDMINDWISKNQIMPRFLRGRGDEEIIKSGPGIKDRILLDGYQRWQAYSPHDTFSWSNDQSGTEWDAGWAYYTTYMSWNDQEILHNIPDGLSKSARINQMKDVKRQKEQVLMTDIVEGLEGVLFAAPSESTMETPSSSTSRVAYSIPALIPDTSTGVPLDSDGADWDGGVIQKIAPGTYAQWAPQRKTYEYSAAGYGDGNANFIPSYDGLFAKMRSMYRALQFRQPAQGQEYFEGNNYDRMFIAASEAGCDFYENGLEAQGDKLRNHSSGPSDPSYAALKFKGHAVEEVASLDTAAVYANDVTTPTALATESAAGQAGPRYYFINTNYMKCIFHRERYLHKHPVKTPDNQIEVYVQPCSVWMNVICTSRRRHGIVSPTAIS
jgi:hypothetical protein